MTIGYALMNTILNFCQLILFNKPRWNSFNKLIIILSSVYFIYKVVDGLLGVIDSNYDNPRVQAHAGAALVNFSEDCPKNILGLYLDPIISKLEQVLQVCSDEEDQD